MAAGRRDPGPVPGRVTDGTVRIRCPDGPDLLGNAAGVGRRLGGPYAPERDRAAGRVPRQTGAIGPGTSRGPTSREAWGPSPGPAPVPAGSLCMNVILADL